MPVERRGTYLVFESIDIAPREKRTTEIWRVTSTSDALLGYVKWFGRWRCYTFQPNSGSVFNDECLRYLADFCSERTATWRANRKAAVAR